MNGCTQNTCAYPCDCVTALSPAEMALRTAPVTRRPEARNLPTSLVPLLLCSAERLKLLHSIVLSWRSCVTLCKAAIHYKGASFVLADQSASVLGRDQPGPGKTTDSTKTLVQSNRSQHTASAAGAIGTDGRPVKRYIDQGQWKGLCSSGWYTFVGCEAEVTEEAASALCPWCAFSLGSNTGAAAGLDTPTREGQAAKLTQGRRHVRATFWCEWRLPTSRYLRRRLLCGSAKLHEGREQRYSVGCCLCRFHRCMRPLSLWIYRHPMDSQPVVVVWPKSMRLMDRGHRWMSAQLCAFTHGGSGSPLLQLLCSEAAPDVCSGFLTHGEMKKGAGVLPRTCGWVWSFDVPDEVEVEVPLQIWCEHPADCQCNCRCSAFARGNDLRTYFGRGASDAAGRGSPESRSPPGEFRYWSEAEAESNASVADLSFRTRPRRQAFLHTFRWRPRSSSVTASLSSPVREHSSNRRVAELGSHRQEPVFTSAATQVTSQLLLPSAGRRGATLQGDGDRGSARLKFSQAGRSSDGFIQDLRRQLGGYSIKVSVERFVMALVSAAPEAPDAAGSEYICRHLRDLGATARLQESSFATLAAQRSGVPFNPGSPSSWAPEESPSTVHPDEDSAGTEQLMRQFGSGGLVLTLVGASVSGSPSLLFPQKDQVSFCLRSMVAENTYVLARSRRRVILQALVHSSLCSGSSGGFTYSAAMPFVGLLEPRALLASRPEVDGTSVFGVALCLVRWLCECGAGGVRTQQNGILRSRGSLYFLAGGVSECQSRVACSHLDVFLVRLRLES